MSIWRKVSDEPAPEGDDIYSTDGLTIWQANREFDPDPACWWTTGAELLEVSGFTGQLPLAHGWHPIGKNSFPIQRGAWILDPVTDEVQYTIAPSALLDPRWKFWQPAEKPPVRPERPRAKVPTKKPEELREAMRETVSRRKP